jgi:hypothetical protein
MVGNSALVGGSTEAGFALLDMTSRLLDGCTTCALVATGLLGQAIELTAVLAGQRSQMDSRIVLFGLMATMMICGDMARIAFDPAVIALHDLSPSIVSGGLIYPDGVFLTISGRPCFAAPWSSPNPLSWCANSAPAPGRCPPPRRAKATDHSNRRGGRSPGGAGNSARRGKTVRCFCRGAGD